MKAPNKFSGNSYNLRPFIFCARYKFFGSKGIDIVENSTLFKRNNPKNISEYKKNYMQDMALVTIGGCVICGNSSNQTITLKFIQSHPKGPIGNICPEMNENISTLELDLTKYDNKFIVGGILSERLCPSRKSLDDEIEIAPLTYKHKFKIEIEHSCEGEKTKQVINFARELELNDLTDHVFEMQGLSINLTGNSTEETYDWEKTLYDSFIPKKVSELKTTTELVPTIETINNTTEASNTTTTKKIVLPKNGVDFDGIYDEEKEDEKMKEEKEEDKEDEIKQGEENVVERINLEGTTHSNDEGKEDEENKSDEITTSRPEEVSTKTEKINEEKGEEKEEINEKLEEKHNEEKEEGENEIKEKEGKDDNESKDEVMNKGNEEENEDGEKENLKENKGEN